VFTKTVFVAVFSLLPASAWAADPKPFPVPPVRESELRAVTGREGISQVTASDQTSVVSHNTISGPSITGAVTFDNQAFPEFKRHGRDQRQQRHNVSINSSFMVNIVIGPRP
jgi:hypothetical protein